MFGFGKKDKLIKELQKANCKLAGELCEAKDDAKTYAAMADQRMETINAMKERIKEIESEKDAMSEGFDQLQNDCRAFEAENIQLREGAGHALHALAAVQDLSTAFVKRLDMLPEYCGLPKDLVNNVFIDFDKDLQNRKNFAKEIEKQSFTVEHYSDDNGVLRSEPGNTEQHFLTIDEIDDAIFGAKSPLSWDDNIVGEYSKDAEKIHELGLYTIEIDLGKNVIAKPRLWVVPSTEDSTS